MPLVPFGGVALCGWPGAWTCAACRANGTPCPSVRTLIAGPCAEFGSTGATSSAGSACASRGGATRCRRKHGGCLGRGSGSGCRSGGRCVRVQVRLHGGAHVRGLVVGRGPGLGLGLGLGDRGYLGRRGGLAGGEALDRGGLGRRTLRRDLRGNGLGRLLHGLLQGLLGNLLTLDSLDCLDSLCGDRLAGHGLAGWHGLRGKPLRGNGLSGHGLRDLCGLCDLGHGCSLPRHALCGHGLPLSGTPPCGPTAVWAAGAGTGACAGTACPGIPPGGTVPGWSGAWRARRRPVGVDVG